MTLGNLKHADQTARGERRPPRASGSLQIRPLRDTFIAEVDAFLAFEFRAEDGSDHPHATRRDQGERR